MTPELEPLLERCLSLPGIASWCIYTKDRNFRHRSARAWFKETQMQKIVSYLTEGLGGLRHHEAKAVRFCWTFEHARIFFTQRPDGHALAFFVENRPEMDAAPYHQALQEFISLPSLGDLSREKSE